MDGLHGTDACFSPGRVMSPQTKEASREVIHEQGAKVLEQVAVELLQSRPGRSVKDYKIKEDDDHKMEDGEFMAFCRKWLWFC